MVNIITQKSGLAKLMATENLFVEHKNVPTASFDLKNRILYLPMWKDISPELYDTLVGHEVGHALDSPDHMVFINGLNKIVDTVGITKEQAKTLVNIVEDARIEKLIKRRYPGLRRSFVAGYKSLVDRGLFTQDGRDINSYSFIDRINLHFKLGNVEAANIKFSKIEKSFIDRIAAADLWSEVVDICIDLAQYMSDDKNSDSDDQGDEGDGDTDASEMTDEKGSSKDKSQDNTEDGDEGDGDDDSSDDEGDDGDDSQSGDGDDDEPGEQENANNANDKQDGNSAGENFKSETQESLDREIEKLNNNMRFSQTDYAFIEDLNSEDFVCDYKRYHAGLTDTVLKGAKENNYFMNRFHKFKNENNPIISYLLREFEAKKAADEYARITTARTGSLDMNKIHTYKFNDDLFKKISIRPGAKNHGLYMLLDWSASMASCIRNTIDQLLVLTYFCRRANIAFEVYAFSDKFCLNPNAYDRKGEKPDPDDKVNYNAIDTAMRKYRLGTLLPMHHTLCNILSSRMTKSEFNQAAMNVMYLGYAFGSSGYSRSTYYNIPERYSMGSTPLNSALLTSRKLIREFKEKNRLQIVNTVILTDGDATDTWLSTIMQLDEKYHIMNTDPLQNRTLKKTSFGAVFTDRKTGYQYDTGKSKDFTQSLLEMIRHYTQAHVVGFFISDRFPYRKFDNTHEKEHLFKETFKKEGSVIIENQGYDEYYIIQQKNLELNYEEFEVGNIKSNNALANKFTKHLSGKLKNRIIMSRFTKMISA